MSVIQKSSPIYLKALKFPQASRDLRVLLFPTCAHRPAHMHGLLCSQGYVRALKSIRGMLFPRSPPPQIDMYVCMYVCMCLYIYVCVYIICACVYVWMCMQLYCVYICVLGVYYICLHVHVYTCVYMYELCVHMLHVFTYTCVCCVWVCVYVCTCVCICIVYMWVYCVYMYMCVCMCVLCVDACMCVCICVCTHVCLYLCFSWSIVDLQCCIINCCQQNVSVIYREMCILLLYSFPLWFIIGHWI